MRSDRHRYFLHPAILDACHVTTAFSLGEPVANHRVPLMIKRVEAMPGLDAAALTPCYCHVQRIKFDAQLAEMDVVLYDSAGRRLLAMEGFTTKAVSNKAAIFDTGSRAAPEPSRAPPAAPPQNDPRQTNLTSAIQAYLRQKVATLLNRSAAEVSVDRNFMELGLESQGMIGTVARIEAELGLELYPTLFFEYQNIAALAAYFKEEHGDKLAAFFAAEAVSGGEQEAAPATAVPREEHRAEPVAVEVPNDATRPRAARATSDAIAIIGMSAYLPRSEDLRAFWGHLISGRDLVEEVPASRWDHRRWYDKDPKAVNKTYSKWGSFLEDVDKFDPQFFGMSPRIAEWMDPQVRLLLQCAQQTFEDAGVINSIGGSRTDVFVGSCYHEYWEEIVRRHIPFSDYQSYSVARSLLSATISYTYDLQGASVPLDNACASSLTALHLACRSIRDGECDQALVAGVNLLLSPLKYVHFSRLGALSPTGRCHTFDQKADGYVPGEGVVSVLVKPLDRAIADGDNIHAVIRGTAVNHVGRSNNPLAPRPELQTRMLLDAWARAGIDPRQLSYLEAHGTGTKLGDPIEIGALTKAFKAHTSDRQFCAIGSTKAHIGHLEAAAGVTSLVKVILMMKHQQIPRMPNFERLNDYLDLKNSPFYVNTAVEPWKPEGGQPRLAGISAFGMSGNNAHVVVEEYVPERRDERGAAAQVSGRVHVVPLSARGEAELGRYATKLLAHIEAEPAVDLGDLAYTLQVGRQAFSHRAAFVVRSQRELGEALRAFIGGRREGASWVTGVVPDEFRVPGQPRSSRPWRRRAPGGRAVGAGELHRLGTMAGRRALAQDIAAHVSLSKAALLDGRDARDGCSSAAGHRSDAHARPDRSA
jgi:rhizoxin synthesis polyketide synthase RhiE